MLEVKIVEDITSIRAITKDGEKEPHTSTHTKMILSFNADIFIVPNPIGTVDVFFPNVRDEMIKTISGMYVKNGSDGKIYADISKPLVQFWICAKEDLGCDNLGSHGAEIRLNAGEGSELVIPISPARIDHMPASFFEGLKEGESLSVVIPYDQKIEGYDEVELHMNLTLAQKKYRYRDHGDFDQVLAKLLRYFYSDKTAAGDKAEGKKSIFDF